MNFLEIFFVTNLVSILAILVSYQNLRKLKKISLIGSFLQLMTFLGIYLDFDTAMGHISQSNLYYRMGTLLPIHLAVDGLNLWFILLILLLLPLCILSSWSVNYRILELHLLLHTLALMLILVFTTQELMLFYIAFEGVLVPMFFVIGMYGSRERKIHAVYQFFLMTLVGSVLMLITILYIYVECGSTEMSVVRNHDFDSMSRTLIWVGFSLGFAVKVPMFPFHIWLPEAHTEAPTFGSMLLAGILLKMGGYGYIKFVMVICPEETVKFKPFVLVFAFIGILYATIITIRQTDLKKIIAYSSVGHMSYVVVGIMSSTIDSLSGSVASMVAHGFISSALFLCVGILYDRTGTRMLPYYGGIANTMPIFSNFFTFLTFANVAFPGTAGFIGELLTFLGVYRSSPIIAILLAGVTLLSAAYAFWLLNRTLFGVQKSYILANADCNKRETLMLLVLSYFILLLGLCPSVFSEPISTYFAYRG